MVYRTHTTLSRGLWPMMRPGAASGATRALRCRVWHEVRVISALPPPSWHAPHPCWDSSPLWHDRGRVPGRRSLQNGAPVSQDTISCWDGRATVLGCPPLQHGRGGVLARSSSQDTSGVVLAQHFVLVRRCAVRGRFPLQGGAPHVPGQCSCWDGRGPRPGTTSAPTRARGSPGAAVVPGRTALVLEWKVVLGWGSRRAGTPSAPGRRGARARTTRVLVRPAGVSLDGDRTGTRGEGVF
jgi:hypothetical protein